MSGHVRKRKVDHDLIAPYMMEMRPPHPLLEWEHVFGNDHPVEVEVGFGKGRFLITAAQESPGANFLGIEISRGLVEFVADRTRIRDLHNVKVAYGNAIGIFRESIKEGSVRSVHFYFPDPWWKKRHHKRRVFKEEMFRSFIRALEPGGLLHIASDVEFVYDEMYDMASTQPELTETEDSAPLCTTNFEDKALKNGRAIGRTAFRRS